MLSDSEEFYMSRMRVFLVIVCLFSGLSLSIAQNEQEQQQPGQNGIESTNPIQTEDQNTSNPSNDAFGESFDGEPIESEEDYSNPFDENTFEEGDIVGSDAPPFDPDDPDVPIDGGIGLLLAAGAGYGLKKIRDRRSAKEQE